MSTQLEIGNAWQVYSQVSRVYATTGCSPSTALARVYDSGGYLGGPATCVLSKQEFWRYWYAIFEAGESANWTDRVDYGNSRVPMQRTNLRY